MTIACFSIEPTTQRRRRTGHCSYRFPILLLCLMPLTLILPSQNADGDDPVYHVIRHDEGFQLRQEPLELSRAPTTLGVAWTADRRHLRSIDINGQITQRETSNAKQPQVIGTTKSEPSTAAISSDGTWLACADFDGGVSLKNLDTGQFAFQDSGQTAPTVALCFSDDTTHLGGVTADGTLRLWTIPDAKLVFEHRVSPGPIQTLSISPKNGLIAIAAHGNSTAIFDFPTTENTKARTIPLDGSPVTSLAFTPQGQNLVIASADGRLNVHSLGSQVAAIPLDSSPFATWSISFDSTGQRMMTGSWDGMVRLWDTRSWECVQRVQGHRESVIATLLDEKQGMISAGMDGRLLHWKPQTDLIHPIGEITGRADAAWVALHSPDGKRLFVGGEQKRFEIWDTRTMRLQVNRNAPFDVVRCASFSQDGKQLAIGGQDGVICLCDGITGETIQKFTRHRSAVSFVAFANQGQTLLGGSDGGEMKVWDVATGQERSSQREHQQAIYCGRLSPDQQWLLTGGGHWQTDDPGEIVVWDQKKGQMHAKLPGHRLAVWSLVFLGDGQRFAASDSTGTVNIWDLPSQKIVQTLSHPGWVRGLALSGDTKTLVVGRGDGALVLRDTETWNQTALCVGDQSFAFSVQYAPDGKTLVAASSDGVVRFWKP